MCKYKLKLTIITMTYNEGDSTHNYIKPFLLFLFLCLRNILLALIIVSCCSGAMYKRQVKTI